MRFSKLLLKITTLAFFILLISGFVWYRALYQEEAPITDQANIQLRKEIDPATGLMKFTIAPTADTVIKPQDVYMMSGSKSGPVLTPDLSFEPVFIIDTAKTDTTKVDSVRIDTLITPKAPDTPVRKKQSDVIMSGTKSMPLTVKLRPIKFSTPFDSSKRKTKSPKKQKQ